MLYDTSSQCYCQLGNICDAMGSTIPWFVNIIDAVEIDENLNRLKLYYNERGSIHFNQNHKSSEEGCP
jgi:hypothetical protein